MKGYWIAHVDVHDPEGYKDYVSRNGVAFAKFGGRFVVRGGQSETVVGALKPRHVVIEFPSYDAAMACMNSPEYAEAAKYRDKAAHVDVVVVQGYEGPQPGDA
ncbi:MAG: DUF1330 domain-containing protein [Alsobacter sp.]